MPARPIAHEPSGFAVAATRVRRAAAQLRRGQPVVLVTGAGSGELVLGAERATADAIGFIVRHSSGYLRVALPERRADALGLPLCAPEEAHRHDVAYAVSVDAAEGVTTGISAADRARTIRLLGSREACNQHFSRPGHVVPLRTWSGGVREVAAVGEAASDLAAAAGLTPVAALAAVVSPADGTRLATGVEVTDFSSTHHLQVISIDDVVAASGSGNYGPCPSIAVDGIHQP